MDLKNYSNDDFSDFFNDSDMKVDEIDDDIQQFISLLGSNNTLETRYESICNIVYKFLHRTPLMEMEEKLFQHIMPAINDLFITIFKEISNVLNAGKNQDTTVCTLKLLRECISMCLGSYEVLDCILTNLLQNDIEFCYVQTVPGELVNILLSTFQHCKESEKTYNDYFTELKEIVQLFRSAEDTHSKLLQLLVSHVNFNFEVDHEIACLQDVLLILGEIGEVLVDMNMKTLVDNWRGYMALIEKHSDVLNKNNYSIKKTVEFITFLIKQTLENILKMNETDQKSRTQSLKMCNFFIKIVVKLCDIFWQVKTETQSYILLFFLSVYRFYPRYLCFKGYSASITNGIEVIVIKGCDSLFEKCILHSGFVREFCEIDVKENLNSPGLLFFTLEVFCKLNNMNSNDISSIKVDILVDMVFKVISESYVELFWSIQTTSQSALKRMLFDESCLNIMKVILLVDAEQFSKIEVILIKNVLQENIWNVLAALEIWHSVLRHKGFELMYKTLVNIIIIMNPLLQNSFTTRPEKIFIEHLLYRLYISLPESYHIKLIEKYSISSHLQLWRCFTFNEFPINCIVFIESLLISIIEKVENFKNGKCSETDFHFLCDGFDVIASLPASAQIDLKHLIVTILQLWDFDLNVSVLQNNTMLKHFIKKLFNVTNRFVLNLTAQQLLCVLLKVKELSSTTLFPIEILQMLKQLSSKSLNQFPEKKLVVTALSSIFSIMYTDSNPIIKQLFLETFVYFLNATSHEEILQSVVKTSEELQSEVTNFIQRKIVNQRGKQLLSGSDYFAKQKCYKFQHKCPVMLQIVKTVDTNDENLNVLVKRIKTDLELLYRMSDKTFVENSVVGVINSFN